MNLIETQRGSFVVDQAAQLVQSPVLLELAWLRHASTLRGIAAPGVANMDAIRQIQDELGTGRQPVVTGQQKHTTHLGVVDEAVLESCDGEGRSILRETDGIICPRPGVSIAIFTADCVPVFLADTRLRRVALAHAGWRGSLGRIAGRAVKQLERLGSHPADIVAWVGPCIGGCCYEVSEELVADFCREFPEKGPPIHDGRLLDLVEVNMRQLREAGVPPGNISASQLCTLHNKAHFYSYRFEGTAAGRIVSFMSVVEGEAEGANDGGCANEPR